ncbi:trihelix transcription factor ENAP1-like [Syzygium oleosum]|uniref:trihelix transcription factor ENAP1-like n=1 Tax=Syzygium oleosum TaxID=219896 RepID=UPI0024B9EA34|nr:trihelix transcription factor ENAP1-like [Syzygium oleosum]
MGDDAEVDPVSSSMADPYRTKRVKRSARGQTALPGRPNPVTRRNARSLGRGGGGGFGDEEDGGGFGDDGGGEGNYGIQQNPSYGNEYQNGHGGNFSGSGRGAQGYVRKRGQENLVPAVDYEAGFPNQGPLWSDYAKFTLLEVWGERFLQLGRKSVRSEDWSEIAEKVSEWARMEFTEVDCRQQLDALKKKYKKERAKMDRTGITPSWMHFRRMDMLMMGTSMEDGGLACGVDSGEFCFADTMVYLDKSNAFDEMRDSPGESESEMDGDEEEDDDMPPPRKEDGGEGMRVLADSIERFGELYEKIESNKREQMLELKKMRANFQQELELQKKEILERAQAEIAKIQAASMDDGDEDEDDIYSE